MAAPWEKDPIIQPAAAPWDKDPLVQPAAAAQPPAAPPAPPPAPAAPDPQRALQLGMQDVGRGTANLVTSPITLANSLFNLPIATADYASRKLGGPEIPFRFRTDQGEQVAEVYSGVNEAVGGPKPIEWEDRTGSERMAGNVIDVATQGLIGGAGLARAATTKAASPNAAPSIADAFLRPYIQDARRTVIGDTAAGAGSGVGLTVAQDQDIPWVPEPVEALLGMLLGGTGGAIGANYATSPRAALETITNSLPDPNTGNFGKGIPPVTNRVAESTARFVQDAATDPQSAAGNIRARTEAARAEGEPVPSTGIASDDIGVIAMERGQRQRDPVPFQESDSRLKISASDRVRDLRDPNADQGAVVRRAGEVREQQVAPLRQQEAAAETTAAGVTQARQQEGAGFAVRRGSDRQAEASRNLDRAVVDETYLPARAQKNAMFDEEGAGTNVDMAGVANRARAVRAEVDQLPESVRQRVVNPALLDDLENIETLPFEAASQLRMQLSEDIAGARKAGQFGLADNLNAIRRDLSGAIDQNAPEAAANYRTEFAPRFRPGPGDEAAKFTKAVDRDNTRSMTPPEKTASRFLSSGEKTTALTRMLADQPSRRAGEQAARDYLLSDYASSVLNNDGTVNAIRAAKWAETNADVLDQFPQLRAEVDGFVNTARQGTQAEEAATARLREARDRRQMTERDVDASAAGTLLRAENGDPKNVAKRIFGGGTYGSERELDEITRTLGADQQAIRGWKAAVAEVLAEQVRNTKTTLDTPDGDLSIAKLQRVFKRHEAALARVFSPSEMNALRRSHKMLEPLQNLSNQATAGSPTVENAQLANGVEAAILAYSGSAITTGMIMKRIKTALALVPGLKEMTMGAKMTKLIERMYFEPELAQHLLTREVKEVKGARWNKKLNQLLGVAEFGREQWGEDE